AVAIFPSAFKSYLRRRPAWFRPGQHEQLLEGLRKAGGARLRPRTVAQFAAAKAGLILVTLKMLPATEPAPGTNAASNRTARRGVFADSRRPTACRRRAAPVAGPRSPDRAALRSQSALRRTDADPPPWQSGQR